MSQSCSSPDLFEQHKSLLHHAGQVNGAALLEEAQTFSPDIFEEHKKLPSFLTNDECNPSSLSLTTVFNSPDLLEEYRSRLPRKEEDSQIQEVESFSSATPVEATPETTPTESDTAIRRDRSGCDESLDNVVKQQGSNESQDGASEEMQGKRFDSCSTMEVGGTLPGEEEHVESSRSAENLLERRRTNSSVHFKQDILETKSLSLPTGGSSPSSFLAKGARKITASANNPSQPVRGYQEAIKLRGCIGNSNAGGAKQEVPAWHVQKEKQVKLVKSRDSGVLKLSYQAYESSIKPTPVQPCNINKSTPFPAHMSFNYDCDSSQSQSQSVHYSQSASQRPSVRQSLLPDDKTLDMLGLEPESKQSTPFKPTTTVTTTSSTDKGSSKTPTTARTFPLEQDSTCAGSDAQKPSGTSVERAASRLPIVPESDVTTSLAKDHEVKEGCSVEKTTGKCSSTAVRVHCGEENMPAPSTAPAITPGPSTVGPSLFSTAKGKSVKISSKSIAKSLSWLNETGTTKKSNSSAAPKAGRVLSTPAQHRVAVTPRVHEVPGRNSDRAETQAKAPEGGGTSLFSTAKGQKISIHKAALDRAKMALNSESRQDEKPPWSTNSVSGSTASKHTRTIKVRKDEALHPRRLATASSTSKPSLFSTARGKSMVVSTEALHKGQKVLEDPINTLPLKRKLLQTPRVPAAQALKQPASKTYGMTPKDSVPSTTSTKSLFSTAKGVPVTFTADALAQAKANLAAERSHPATPLLQQQGSGQRDSTLTGPKTELSLFSTAKGAPVAFSEATLKKAKASLAAESSVLATPMLRPHTAVKRDSILTVRKAQPSLFSTAKGSRVALSAAGLKRAKQVLADTNANSSAPVLTSKKAARPPRKKSSKFVTPRLRVPVSRKPCQEHKEAPPVDPPAAPKPVLEPSKEKRFMLTQLAAARLPLTTASDQSTGLTWIDAQRAVFDPQSRRFTGFDGVGLGWKAIRSELLALGAPVNERQATAKWVQNHVRWVVWKLLGTARLFPQVSGLRDVTVDVVVNQLYRRYTREHMRAQRPALRMIMEQDMPYGSHIVVCVAAVVGVRNLVITDGWYAMVASIDSSLQALVKRKRIFPGFKLHICGASMKNNAQGIDPLDALVNAPHVTSSMLNASTLESEAMLCLTANCTKPAKWDARLGWQKGRPLMKRLCTVVPTGGTVPLIKGVVTRVYPLVFSEKYPDGRRLVRSEREEDLRRDEYAEQQRIANEGAMQKLQQRWGEQLSGAAEEEKRAMLDEALKGAEIGRRNVNRLLRFRLVQQAPAPNLSSHRHTTTKPYCFYCRQDSHSSAACSKPRCNTAEVSIWNPTDNLVSIIKEGKFALGFNVVPNGMSKRLNLLRLTTSRWTRWKGQDLGASAASSYGYVPRGLTAIGAVWTLPMTSAFDTVGCVAHRQEIISPETQQCSACHVFLISNQPQARPVSFTYHCASAGQLPQGITTVGHVVAVRDLLFESVDPATGICACSFLSSSSFTSRRSTVCSSGWRHLEDKFKDMEAWASRPGFAEELQQAGKQLAQRITSGRTETESKPSQVLLTAAKSGNKQSPTRQGEGASKDILPQKRKSMSKQEKKMQRLKMAQAKQAAWKKRHTKENLHQNDEATSKRLEIRTNIKYELLSYIMLGKKSVFLRLRTGVYKSLKHGDLIHFQSGPQSQTCVVQTAQPYDSLEQLLKHEDFRHILPAVESSEKCLQVLSETYSPESVERCGVVAIHLTFSK